MSEIVTLSFPGNEPERTAEVIAAPFMSGHIPCFMHDGEPMVILKPIAEDVMGLSWPRQYAKLSADQTACVAFKAIQVPGDDQVRRHMGISLETFAVWLARLQPSRVKPEARETVLAYQREAGRALRAHFFGQPAAAARRPASGIALLEEMVAELRAQHERTAVLEAKVSAIEGRHDWFTALGYAKLTDRPTDRPYLQRVGMKATRLLAERGEQPVKRQDATFGAVNTYPSDVLDAAFEAVER